MLCVLGKRNNFCLWYLGLTSNKRRVYLYSMEDFNETEERSLQNKVGSFLIFLAYNKRSDKELVGLSKGCCRTEVWSIIFVSSKIVWSRSLKILNVFQFEYFSSTKGKVNLDMCWLNHLTCSFQIVDYSFYQKYLYINFANSGRS